jgi:hypothetical protein
MHHHIFADWVSQHSERFFEVLTVGERLVGEWLALAHGTRYNPAKYCGWEPFVAFDIFTTENKQLNYKQFEQRINFKFHLPPLVSYGQPCSIKTAQELLPNSGYGGEHVEGYMWRVERKGAMDFMCKWVNPDFEPGCLLSDMYWNWR